MSALTAPLSFNPVGGGGAIASGSLAVATVAGGAVFGSLALQENQAAQKAASQARAIAGRDGATGKQVGANVLYGASAVAGALAAGFTTWALLTPEDGDKP